jgi:transcription elongation factor GreB
VDFQGGSAQWTSPVDPESPRAGQAATRAFFGATVRYANAVGTGRVVSIVGTDEVDLNRNRISCVSPLECAIGLVPLR